MSVQPLILPQRIQRKRSKGYRMQAHSPDGRPVVSVCRPGPWGNPFRVGSYAGLGGEPGAGWYRVSHTPSADTPTHVATAEQAVSLYRQWLRLSPPDLTRLRGKHLACYCALTQPCHADVLLASANGLAP